MTKKTSRRGRPRGSKTGDGSVAATTATRCRKCGSTDRGPYQGVRTITAGGKAPDGKPYNAVKFCPTKCRHCGQRRVDKIYLQQLPE